MLKQLYNKLSKKTITPTCSTAIPPSRPEAIQFAARAKSKSARTQPTAEQFGARAKSVPTKSKAKQRKENTIYEELL